MINNNKNKPFNHIIYYLLLFHLANPLVVFAKEKRYVAVIDFAVTGDLGFADPGKGIAQMMVHPLLLTGEFRVFERILLRKVIDEQYFSESQHVDDQQRANKLGEMLGVAAIVSGSVVQWGETVTITSQLIDTTTGEVLTSAQLVTNQAAIDQLPNRLPELTQVLAGKRIQPIAKPKPKAKPTIAQLTKEQAKFKITQYYRDKGQWKGVFMIHKIAKLRLDRINSTQVTAHVHYRYIPIPGSRRKDSGWDKRRFSFRWLNRQWQVVSMGGYQSGNI